MPREDRGAIWAKPAKKETKRHPLLRMASVVSEALAKSRQDRAEKAQKGSVKNDGPSEGELELQTAPDTQKVAGGASRRARFVEGEADEEAEGLTTEPVRMIDEDEQYDSAVDVQLTALEEEEVEEDPVDEFDEWQEDMRNAMEDLDAALCGLYPHFLPGVPSEEEVEFELAVKAAKNPLVQFNGLLSGFCQPPNPKLPVRAAVERAGRSRVPNLLIATGHNGEGGNIGLNGFYDRHPNDYNEHPTYQKLRERRAEMDPFEVTRHIHSRRDWEEHDPYTRVLLHRDRSYHTVPRPRREFGSTEILPALTPKFLFFDQELGGWCIGPKVGSSEIFARCPAIECLESVPFGLFDWEVWDVGQLRWYEHEGFKVFKAGDAPT